MKDLLNALSALIVGGLFLPSDLEVFVFFLTGLSYLEVEKDKIICDTLMR